MKKKILIFYYSHSSQTRKLVQAFADGLRQSEAEVVLEQFIPVEKIHFPLGSVPATLGMMVKTFFRKRTKIEPPSQGMADDCNLVILAGPTWSYSPSGPVLSFLDQFGSLLEGKTVMPLISCRGYWRLHYWTLQKMLRSYQAKVTLPIVFLHPGKEPWRTIGVFMKLAGGYPESGQSWISRYYRKYGHTRSQIEYAKALGVEVAKLAKEGDDFDSFSRKLV